MAHGFEVQKLVALRLPAKRMGGGVADHIGLGFDDSPADPPFRTIMHQGLPDQKSRQFRRIDRQVAAFETFGAFQQLGYGVTSLSRMSRDIVEKAE